MNLFVAYLLGALTAIMGKGRTSHNNENELKHGQCKLHSDKPLAVVSISPLKTDEENRKEKKEDRRKAIKFYSEIAGVAILAIYTFVTVALWANSQEQLRILRDSRDRAWVKFSENTITLKKGIEFKPSSNTPSEVPTAINIGLTHAFTMENLGKLPARNYALDIEPFLYGEKGPRENWKVTTCNAADRKLYTFSANGLMAKGNVMFPGIATQEASSNLSFPSTIHNIAFLYVAACVAYQDVNGDTHHTAVIYCQEWTDQENTTPKPVKVLDKPEVWWSFPTSNFKACMADAD